MDHYSRGKEGMGVVWTTTVGGVVWTITVGGVVWTTTVGGVVWTTTVGCVVWTVTVGGGGDGSSLDQTSRLLIV